MLVSRFVAVTALATVAALSGACASDEDPVPFADPPVTGRNENPDRVSYPEDGQGGTPRAGKRRGDRIPNFTFQGYPDSNRAGGLKPVSLADYYDPEQKRAKVLHLMVAAVWCPICDGQTKEMVTVKSELPGDGVVVLQAIMNGQRQSVGASTDEMALWIDRYPTWFTVVFDERAKRVGTITSVDALPWNMFIDLRTMEILQSYGGRPVPYRAAALEAVRWVDANPPSY